VRWVFRGYASTSLVSRPWQAEPLGRGRRWCRRRHGRIDHHELATPLSFNHFLGRQYGDFMSLAHSPRRFALRGLSSHTHVPNLYLSGQDVAAAGVSGAVMGGAVAASAVLGRDVFADLRTSK